MHCVCVCVCVFEEGIKRSQLYMLLVQFGLARFHSSPATAGTLWRVCNLQPAAGLPALLLVRACSSPTTNGHSVVWAMRGCQAAAALRLNRCSGLARCMYLHVKPLPAGTRCNASLLHASMCTHPQGAHKAAHMCKQVRAHTRAHKHPPTQLTMLMLLAPTRCPAIADPVTTIINGQLDLLPRNPVPPLHTRARTHKAQHLLITQRSSISIAPLPVA